MKYEIDDEFEHEEAIIKEAAERMDLAVQIDYLTDADGEYSWTRLEVLPSQAVVTALVAAEAQCLVDSNLSIYLCEELEEYYEASETGSDEELDHRAIAICNAAMLLKADELREMYMLKLPAVLTVLRDENAKVDVRVQRSDHAMLSWRHETFVPFLGGVAHVDAGGRWMGTQPLKRKYKLPTIQAFVTEKSGDRTKY